MSIGDVTSRISAIQAQLDLLAPQSNPVSSAAFADVLSSTALTSASASPGVPAAGATADGLAVVEEAKQYLGVPYVWGGTSPTGMDCSGLVQMVYEKFGYDLPRVSADQARAGRPVASMAEAQPGDLIAWDNSSRNNGVDHIAIYIGGGKMIEAPRTGLNVRIVDVPTTPDVIRRILPDGAAVTGPTATATAGGAVPSFVPYADAFNTAGRAHGVSPLLLSAVARQESGFDADAVSSAGAQGLMQLMPATAKGLGVTDSFNPTQAVDGAARLLKDLMTRFGSTELALAAYNAGPGAVLKYDGIPPYAETQNYVRSIMRTLEATT
ncbi:transglycosylase SLT domain-containing protein [uncultured Nocardioides sp.]|uniref:GH23 n=1 Tax=uncultured Nocardioides sp. TaxID=198441 RepID=A0A6J4MZJ4_9ACTN|nr:transglycosylase SLT domain-containing protein [uncultured Nocardioides sp.]CAA9373557.1 MAG: GH23 [uncultured Nocardioides sp.]